MKKIILVAFAILTFSAAGFAQTTQKAAEPSTHKKEHKIKSTTIRPQATQNMTNATAPKAMQAEKKMKPVATTGPSKKNGTPDMRYKANKTAVATNTHKHLKKNGTPDKRYSENKQKS